MTGQKAIKTVLVSVYHKTGLEPLLEVFKEHSVRVISTGGTSVFLRSKGIEVQDVSDLTGFPEILDGRVKTLHPLIFGGLLAIRANEKHQSQMNIHGIPPIDAVIVDLYPFSETRMNPEATEAEITEQIDIGGISLIRAAAKNHDDVAVISSFGQYGKVVAWMREGNGTLNQVQRKQLAAEALRNSSAYDMEIADWLSGNELPSRSAGAKTEMRYGENPHQKAAFYGNPEEMFLKLSGKDISYNNLNDLDGALQLIREFQNSEEPVFAIIKHTQACGLAAGKSVSEAWTRALACDPTSAFGGVIVCNKPIDTETAQAIHALFFEIICAPGYSVEALELLSSRKNRIILQDRGKKLPEYQTRSVLGGLLVQTQDRELSDVAGIKIVSGTADLNHPDIRFAEIAMKHLKSNAIVLVKDRQMIGAGSGQTSRVDAVRQAIARASQHGFSTAGAVLGSDAFFPFPDNLQLALDAGVGLILQPGGSVKDAENIEFCKQNGLNMVFTGIRHFKH